MKGLHGHRFWRDQRGATFVFVAAAAFMMVIAVGTAIDMARVQMVRNKVQSALDAAAISAGSFAISTEPLPAAQRYFDANYPPGYMGARIQPVQMVSQQNGNVLNFSVAGDMDTVFSKFIGVKTRDVGATSQVTRVTDKTTVELALVLDDTGSMNPNINGGADKVGQLKTAVGTLMDILLNTDADSLKVSVVPFNTMVNLSNFPQLTFGDPFPPPDTETDGCVAEGAGSRDAGSPGRFWHLYYQDMTGNDREDQVPLNQNDAYCVDINDPSNVLPPLAAQLTTKDAVMNVVNQMKGVGETRVNIGALWGWRTLSPVWTSVFGAAPTSTPNLLKVAIIMTDGSNSTVTGDGASSTDDNNNDLSAICSSMKSSTNHIEVFTIAFRVTDPGVDTAQIQTLLRGCASDPKDGHFFNAEDGNQLINAFRLIADSINKLRLSK